MADYKFPDTLDKKRLYKSDLEAKVNDTLTELDALNLAILADVQALVGDEYEVTRKTEKKRKPRTVTPDIDTDSVLTFVAAAGEDGVGAGAIAEHLNIETSPKLTQALGGLVDTEQLRSSGNRRGKKYHAV